jgi:flagella basal body P-ring formation protein FlgA
MNYSGITDPKYSPSWNMLHAVTVLVLLSMSLSAGRPMVLDFHDTVLVNDTVFTLGDIAAISGNDRMVIEQLNNTFAGISAPPSYSRSIAVNDLMTRLRPKFAPFDMTISGSMRPLIKTDFREIILSTYETDVKAYLDSIIGWKTGEWSVELRNLSETVKVLNAPAAVVISGLETQRFPKGATALALQISQGSRNYRINVQCFITVKCPVVTALHDIERGRIMSSGDGEMQTVDITRFAPVPITGFGMLTGKRAARSIQRGAIFHNRLLQTIPIIEKNDPVMILHQCKGVAISVTGTAREQGGTGDRIWVENHTTHKLIRVTIIAKGKVALATGDVAL